MGRNIRSIRRRITYILIFLYLCHSTTYTNAYSITFFDCANIQHLKTYRLYDVCKPFQQSDSNATKQYQLLQKRSVRKMSGHGCRVVRSKVTDYCGAYGHIKHVKMPEIAVSKTISPQTCQTIIATGRFISDDGTSHPVNLQTENVIHTQELGTIELGDDSVTCRGMPMTVGGHVINDIYVAAQYVVTLTNEEYLVRGTQVEVVDGHTTLPENICGMDQLGCTTHDVTYIWTKPNDLCEFESIRSIEVTEEAGYLVDRENKIILKKGALVSTGANCPAGMIQHTNYHQLYLAYPGVKFPPATDEADVATYINGRDDYVLFEAENLVRKHRDVLQGTVCQNRLEERGTRLFKVKGNQFVRRNGDTLEHFVCTRKRGKIKADPEHCYEEIPMEDGTFVKVPNRLITKHASVIPCNNHYGLKIQTLEGPWIEITKTVRQIAAPEVTPVMAPGYRHEDLATGGIYTEAEMKSWAEKIMYGDLHSAIVNSLTLGICHNDGTCPVASETPAYNLKNLITAEGLEHLADDINPLKKVKEWIKDNTVWICLLDLVFMGIRFLVFWASVGSTMLQEGIAGVIAAFYVLCCSSKISSERIIRKGRRK